MDDNAKLQFMLTVMEAAATQELQFFMYWMKLHKKNSRKHYLRYTMRERIPRQMSYLRDLVTDVRDALHDNLRLRVDTFNKLCCILEVRGGLTPGKYVSIREMVTSFLGVLAHSKKQRLQKFDFIRSLETVHRHFYAVLHAVLRLHGVLLMKPHAIVNNNAFKYFENNLGALDGTYIELTVDEIDKPRYRTRKGQIATNVLRVYDENMNFIYILSGWEGSAADGRVLREALMRNPGFRVQKGHYYLADSGYTNSEVFLTPFRSYRYHLRRWRPPKGLPTNEFEYFNWRHAKARNVIERAWGLLKKQWAILRQPSLYKPKSQNKIILACCLLHNFIRREMEIDPWEEEVDEEYEEIEVDDTISSIENAPG